MLTRLVTVHPILLGLEVERRPVKVASHFSRQYVSPISGCAWGMRYALELTLSSGGSDVFLRQKVSRCRVTPHCNATHSGEEDGIPPWRLDAFSSFRSSTLFSCGATVERIFAFIVICIQYLLEERIQQGTGRHFLYKSRCRRK